MFNREKLLAELDHQGYSIVEGALSAGFIERAKIELASAIEFEARYHRRTDYADYGMVLLCSLYGGAFLDLFDQQSLIEPINAALGESCIVYAYTSSSMPPHASNYSRRIHVDCPRLIPNYMTNLGVTIALDDFTEENGATWYLPGSHNLREAPDEEVFIRSSCRLIVRAGTAFLFNARLWHAGGTNSSTQWRHALTLNMCRPYMKQRIDIPRAMEAMDLSKASPAALQKLGFYSQVPANYDEYYLPADLRKFSQSNE